MNRWAARFRYFFHTANIVIRDEGIIHTLSAIVRLSIEYVRFQTTRSGHVFTFRHEQYSYFSHPYNCTWNNERQIEIPIVEAYMTRHRGKRTLEIGNVTSHYFSEAHDIVDKYESAPNVRNVDVVDFTAEEPYDLIVSVSTLEHVGWDETPRTPNKVLIAIEHLQQMLNPTGTLLVTLPIGYSPAVDAYLEEGMLRFDEQHYYRRDSKNGIWHHVGYDDVKGLRFDFVRHRAAGLVVGLSYGTNSDQKRSIP